MLNLLYTYHELFLTKYSYGSGSDFFTQVRSFFCCLGLVGSATSGSGKFPPKITIFSIFSLWVKKTLVKSGQKISRSELAGPLFSAGQKFARVG